MLDALPTPFVLPVDMPEFSGDCPVGVWMRLARSHIDHAFFLRCLTVNAQLSSDGLQPGD